MCGIAGFFSADEKFGKGDLRDMTQTLAHRGPDAEGFYLNKHVGLGHRRLSVIDLSNNANQPFYSRDNRYVIAFNGEVYNYQEIRKGLDYESRTNSDTEVILQSFIQKGPGFVEELIGMFVIVIYDSVEDKMYFFRDRMGIKPLYYYKDGDDLVFASELKSIVSIQSIKPKLSINQGAINNFLYLGYIPEPQSIYRQIHKFPSASYLTVSKSQFDFTSYWEPENFVEENAISNFHDAKTKLKELLMSSIKYRMIADVPLGTFLSGGIDSSIVTAIAQELTSNPVKTFSIGFKERKFNESEYARSVARYMGTEHYDFVLSEAEAKNEVLNLLDIYDEPYGDSSAIPTLLVSKMARKHVTVALSGDGGDELFLGYNKYVWAERLSNPLIKMTRPAIHKFLKTLPSSKIKRVAHLFDNYQKEHFKSHVFSQESYCFTQEQLELLMLKADNKIQLDENLKSSGRRLSKMEEQSIFDLKYYLKDDLLVKVDRASMFNSLEVRVPILDHRVVEFALNLSKQLKFRNGITKYILKDLLYDYIPKKYFERPKSGFSIPLSKWLKNDFKFLFDQYLNRNVIDEVGVVDSKMVKTLERDYFSGKDYLYVRLWNLIILHKWFLEKSR